MVVSKWAVIAIENLVPLLVLQQPKVIFCLCFGGKIVILLKKKKKKKFNKKNVPIPN